VENTGLKVILKGLRWLLLMGVEKFNAKSKDARERLNNALAFNELNEPLAKAYSLKEELRIRRALPEHLPIGNKKLR